MSDRYFATYWSDDDLLHCEVEPGSNEHILAMTASIDGVIETLRDEGQSSDIDYDILVSRGVFDTIEASLGITAV